MITVPKAIKEISDAFTSNGHTFWLVGGYVRDVVMARDGMDVDATTNAKPEEIKAVVRPLFPDALYEVGAKYGTIAIKYKGFDVEITTYRTEQYSEGSRHPEVVFGKSLEQDLDRRDFTINALAYSPYTDIQVDLHGGMDDIKYRTVRAVGNPTDRFNEDPLRMLRAIRFACQLGFSIDSATWIAILNQAEQVQELSWERVRDELVKILCSDRPSGGLRMLFDSGLMHYILPEVAQLDGIPQRGPHHNADVLTHTLGVVDNTPPDPVLRLAALFHDVGKASTREEVYE